MTFQPSDTLRSRTFIGLLLAQFLAAFNDQAIHASAMFYAIKQRTLDEGQAISLMPILFYAPWLLFSTLAGYLADRFSKRNTLVFWKAAEVGITLLALAGFYLGSEWDSTLGPYLVLSTVFLMGLHSTFFVPAKYGAMPEILQPQMLSRGNGLLESLSFTAVILGTVTGGVLSYTWDGDEYKIGLLLVALAVLGVVASLFIEKMPAANLQRRFPRSIYGPLFSNLRVMVQSRPLNLAVLGIAFFTFVVVFMRASVYMHGESHLPRWTERETSIIVGMTALGIGLGSPLAGFLSGGKLELGLIPVGGLGMILCTLLAALAVAFDWLPGLIACLILIGFWTGFYLVPMFTLLQYRAPKTSKGDLVATNNFVSVTGAILASAVFFGVEQMAPEFGLARSVPQTPVVSGLLTDVVLEDGRPSAFQVQIETEGGLRVYDFPDRAGQQIRMNKKGWIQRLDTGDAVDVATYQIGSVTYYSVREASEQPLGFAYDKSELGRYLFVAAALITLATLVLLRIRLPDLVLRSLIWFHALGRYRLKVVGMQYLPSDGPVILATNCRRIESCLQVLAVTDRYTRFVFEESPSRAALPTALRLFLWQSRLADLPPDEATAEDREKVRARVLRALAWEQVVAVTANGTNADVDRAGFLDEISQRTPAVVVPVFSDLDVPGSDTSGSRSRRVRVVIGAPLPPGTPAVLVRAEIHRLAEPGP
jgi:MFS family permease